MKNKKFIIAIVVLISAIYLMVGYNSLKSINKEKIDVSKYIEIVDEVSNNKVQINWKYVASIIGVKGKNKFENVLEQEIKEVSNLFIEKSNNKYKLNSLDQVLSELNFNKIEKQRTKTYIEQLKYYGLIPSRVAEGTKYKNFINEIKDEAIDNYKEYKILPSITIAQAILESGWGESSLAKNYNNLFGIKADIYWDGDYVTLETLEFKDDNVVDKFRKYNNKANSLEDHAKFLVNNKRYKEHGVFDSKTYIEQAKKLEDAGYSTAIDDTGQKVYAKRLINLIRQYDLQLIDSQVQS